MPIHRVRHRSHLTKLISLGMVEKWGVQIELWTWRCSCGKRQGFPVGRGYHQGSLGAAQHKAWAKHGQGRKTRGPVMVR